MSQANQEAGETVKNKTLMEVETKLLMIITRVMSKTTFKELELQVGNRK
jgi:hypothetical protein